MTADTSATPTTPATPAAGSIASDINLATGAASLAAAASGNAAVVPGIVAAGHLAQMLNSSLALVQSGHISAAGWAKIQSAFAEAVANWNAA